MNFNRVDKTSSLGARTNLPYIKEVETNETLKMILHVGPGKMGTTTIQKAMEEDLEELSMDNFCVYNPKKFLQLSRILNAFHSDQYTNFNEMQKKVAEIRDDKGMKEMLDYFDHCFRIKQNMLLSSEFLGLLDKEIWEGVLKPSLERWDMVIAVGYRRFYNWAPSVWFQIMRQLVKKEWPDTDTEKIIPFKDWYFNQENQRLKWLYTNWYIDHWKGLGIEKFLVYNMHQDPNLEKHFYCSTLGLQHSCDKRSNTTDEKLNIGHSIENDRLACALYSLGHINPEKTSRKEAGEMISDFFMKKGTSLDKVSQICFTDEEMSKVLEKSKKIEAELLPEFYASSQGEVTMADELEKAKGKFCGVNITDVVRQYGEELQSLFAYR